MSPIFYSTRDLRIGQACRPCVVSCIFVIVDNRNHPCTRPSLIVCGVLVIFCKGLYTYDLFEWGYIRMRSVNVTYRLGLYTYAICICHVSFGVIYVCRPRMEKSHCDPTRVYQNVNIIFHKNQMGSIIRSSGTVFYSPLYVNSRLGFYGTKYLYSVISVKIDPLPANAKNGESTRSWTARVRFLHPWAGYLYMSRHR